MFIVEYLTTRSRLNCRYFRFKFAKRHTRLMNCMLSSKQLCMDNSGWLPRHNQCDVPSIVHDSPQIDTDTKNDEKNCTLIFKLKINKQLYTNTILEAITSIPRLQWWFNRIDECAITFLKKPYQYERINGQLDYFDICKKTLELSYYPERALDYNCVPSPVRHPGHFDCTPCLYVSRCKIEGVLPKGPYLP